MTPSFDLTPHAPAAPSEARPGDERRATLAVTLGRAGLSDDSLRGELISAGLAVRGWSVQRARSTRRVECEVRWRALPPDATLPSLVGSLIANPGVHEVSWKE